MKVFESITQDLLESRIAAKKATSAAKKAEKEKKPKEKKQKPKRIPDKLCNQ